MILLLDFKPVTLEDNRILTPILSKFGGKSCQHSFASMTGLFDKYGDEFVIEDGVLIVHRAKRDHDGYRVYLAPIGDTYGSEAKFLDMILEDAHSYGAKVSFETVTEDFREKVANLLPDFEVIEDRDYAEYIYSVEKMSVLPGHALAAKRNRVRAFYSAYEDHIRIENISPGNMNDVRAFQDKWISERKKSDDDPMLETENNAIGTYFDNFDALGFKGIVVYVYGSVVGYAAGVALSDDTMDEVIEKGLPEITGIYQLLCNEFALICCKGYEYVNREEDIGLEGLRRAKMSYQPDILLSKYIMREQ